MNQIISLQELAARAVLTDPDTTIKSYAYSGDILHKTLTNSDLEKTQKALERLSLPDSIYVFTSGSDSRMEKSCGRESPVEFIVICDEKDELEERIANLAKELAPRVDTRIEWKNGGPLLTCTITNKHFPPRYLHTYSLKGNPEQQLDFTKGVITEIQEMPGKKRRSFIQNALSPHLKQMREVISGSDRQDVDLINETISYSGMGRKATKYSLLRPIQYTLDLVIIDWLRQKELSTNKYAEFLTSMPRQTHLLIDYMINRALLPALTSEDIQDLKQAYSIGLFYFHLSQHLFANIEGPLSFPIPKADVEAVKKAYINTERVLKKIR